MTATDSSIYAYTHQRCKFKSIVTCIITATDLSMFTDLNYNLNLVSHFLLHSDNMGK